MIQYGYLVVEGHHDAEFVGGFLKLRGCERITKLSELNSYWRPLVPSKFPDKGDLNRRMPVPTFFQSATHSIAVHSAGGEPEFTKHSTTEAEAIEDSKCPETIEETEAIEDSKFPETIEETLAVICPGNNKLIGLGIILDADKKESPNARFNKIREGIKKLNFVTELPIGPGEVALGQPHCGVFIMPDNLSAGTLEDLLMECAEQSYPSLLQCTHPFLSCIDPLVLQLPKRDRKYFQKPAGRNKVIIGSLANVLRPGKSVQVSIQDNSWVTADTVKLPRLAKFDKFLRDLFSL